MAGTGSCGDRLGRGQVRIVEGIRDFLAGDLSGVHVQAVSQMRVVGKRLAVTLVREGKNVRQGCVVERVG